MVFSKLGGQIQNLGGATDRGTSQEHAVGGAALAAPDGPQKRRCTGATAPVLRARDCLPGPFPPDAYKRPLGVLQKGISRARVMILVCF